MANEVLSMKREQLHDQVSNKRHNERGAALITAVLLSMLLLSAGGILILTTSLTGVTARDSTAEMQAYYAAEAGVSRTLEVIRGNVDSTPTGTRATFHNIVCSPSLWTATSGNTLNVATDGSSGFRVLEIKDPDDLTGSKCSVADYKPERLFLKVLGIGPRFAQKKLEVVVSRFTLNYPVEAVVTLPNTSGNPIAFDLGDSTVTTTSGADAAPGSTTPPISAYAIDTNDEQTVNNVLDGCEPDGTNCSGSGPNVDPPDPLVLTPTNRPSFLSTVETARLFLYGPEGMKQAALNQGRYFQTGAEAIASPVGLGAGHPDGAFTFVDGDLTLGPPAAGQTVSGQGTLIVTGTLTLNGSFSFNGVIMVLGAGTVQRSGGGDGNIYGAIFVAKFSPTGSSTDQFQAPSFNTDGGGTANIQYHSTAIDQAKSVGGHAVLGVREY
jgi:hypothetical protein